MGNRICWQNITKKHTNSSRPQTDEAHVSRKPQCLITVHSSWCFTTFDFVLPNVFHRLTQGKRMDLRTKRLRFWATRTKTWPPWAEKAPCAAMMWKSINSEVNTSLKKVCKLAHLYQNNNEKQKRTHTHSKQRTHFGSKSMALEATYTIPQNTSKELQSQNPVRKCPNSTATRRSTQHGCSYHKKNKVPFCGAASHCTGWFIPILINGLL